MLSVGKNVSECFELHLRGSDILKFSGEPAPNPTSKASFLRCSYSPNILKRTFIRATTIYFFCIRPCHVTIIYHLLLDHVTIITHAREYPYTGKSHIKFVHIRIGDVSLYDTYLQYTGISRDNYLPYTSIACDCMILPIGRFCCHV